MINEQLYQAMFGAAFLLWLIATMIATRAYAVTVIRMGWGYPFVIASLWIGIINVAEAAMFLATAVLALDTHDNIRLVVLYYIPIGLALKAIVFIIVGWWVMKEGKE